MIRLYPNCLEVSVSITALLLVTERRKIEIRIFWNKVHLSWRR